jgi:MFS family permease
MEGGAETERITQDLMVQQAQALVQGERDRFLAMQSQAISLLALAGVVAGIGGAFLAGFIDHDFEWPVQLCGIHVPLALLAALALVLLTLGALGSSALRAIGVLQRRPDPDAAELPAIVRDQFAEMGGGGAAAAPRILFKLLSEQLKRTQEVNEGIRSNLSGIASALGLAVFGGLFLAALLVVGTKAHDDKDFIIREGAKGSLTVESTR